MGLAAGNAGCHEAARGLLSVNEVSSSTGQNLGNALNGDVGRKLQFLFNIVYEECKNTFGLIPARARPRQSGPIRRQQQIASLCKAA